MNDMFRGLQLSIAREYSEAEIAWFAGLFEGEGCIYIDDKGKVRLTVRMTDLDIIERVNAMFPCSKIQVVNAPPRDPGGAVPKTAYAWNINKRTEVRDILKLILPWLGERRSLKAMEALNILDIERPFGRYNAEKTECPYGHPYSPENTYKSPGRNHRNCRECMRESNKRGYLRRKTEKSFVQ